MHLQPPPADAATEEHARALYARWFAGADAGQDFVAAVSATIAPQGVVHLGNGDTGNRRTLGRMFERIGSAIHDLQLQIDEVYFDGPRVIAPFSMSGIHRGRVGIYAPTGRALPSSGLLLARADEDGNAAEVWLYVAPGYALALPPGQTPAD